ncbi:MAG TPA: hypothetical protein VHH11_06795 [Gammaproteobacteria bacterium]|jgi:hypothetical protein|nr:hypothetical protein [Gammaproteobacteria bacterium]
MRPSVALLGFVLGSTAAISFALAGVAIIFVVLRSEYPRLETELPLLVGSLGIFLALTAMAGASFYAQARRLAWRWLAHVLLGAGLALATWYYWQR